MTKLADFEIRLTYFKPSGKWYTEATLTLRTANCGTATHPCCYMNGVADLIRDSRDGGFLPGLTSGRWDGPILINCDQGYPVLVLPDTNGD